jgi:hypothetical protein
VGKVFKGNKCFEIFATMIISYSFLYRLATYHWKAFKEGYNFVFENTSNQNSYEKITFPKVTFSQGDMVALKAT